MTDEGGLSVENNLKNNSEPFFFRMTSKKPKPIIVDDKLTLSHQDILILFARAGAVDDRLPLSLFWNLARDFT